MKGKKKMSSQATLNYQSGIRFADSNIQQFSVAPATALWNEYQSGINNTANKILSHEYGVSEASLDYYADKQNYSQSNDPLEMLIRKEEEEEQQEEADTFLGSLSTTRRNIVIGLKNGKSKTEIADKIGCTKPNILYHIDKIWEKHGEFAD